MKSLIFFWYNENVFSWEKKIDDYDDDNDFDGHNSQKRRKALLRNWDLIATHEKNDNEVWRNLKNNIIST